MDTTQNTTVTDTGGAKDNIITASQIISPILFVESAFAKGLGYLLFFLVVSRGHTCQHTTTQAS
jgi:hypothetical protein